MKKIRVGIAGCGLISESAHVPAVLVNPRAELVALIDPSAARRHRIRDQHGIVPAEFDHVTDAVDGIDALIVATPNHTHAAIARAALDAGVHVLIEKPLANTVNECRVVAASAARSGAVAAVGYNVRLRDQMLLLKDVLQQRTFGEARAFAFQFGMRGGWAPVSNYITSRDQIGGGVLVVSGTHFLDAMLWLFGEPDGVEYEDDSEGGPEANCTAFLSFGQGSERVEGALRLSKTATLSSGFVVETDEGILTTTTEDRAPLVFRPKRNQDIECAVNPRRARAFPAEMNSYARQFDRFLDACQGGDPTPLASLAEGTAVVRLTERLYAARHQEVTASNVEGAVV